MANVEMTTESFAVAVVVLGESSGAAGADTAGRSSAGAEITTGVGGAAESGAKDVETAPC